MKFLKRWLNPSWEYRCWAIELFDIAQDALRAAIEDEDAKFIHFKATTISNTPREKRFKIRAKYVLTSGQIWEAEIIIFALLSGDSRHPLTHIEIFGEVYLFIAGMRYVKIDLKASPPKVTLEALTDECSGCNKALKSFQKVFASV